MEMIDLKNKRVKISAGTITVKDENDKTCGMVRGVRPFKSWAPREAAEYFKSLKASGIWGSRDVSTENVILDGKQLYYLNDLRPLQNYERMRAVFESDPAWESEVRHYQVRKAIAEQAAAAGMIVIDCYVI